MPNGYEYEGPGRRRDAYNADWCKERHRLLNQRIDKLDGRMWIILTLLFGNLVGIIGVFVKLLVGGLE